MSRSQTRPARVLSPERGQTEPLVALVAVALFCLALSVYAAFVTGLVPDLGSDRELAEVTGGRIWEAVSEDGIYPADADFRADLDPGDLPRGFQVAVNVTSVDLGGRVAETGQVRFDETGSVARGSEPLAGDVFQRPVPVQRRHGDVRPGTLSVVISDGE